MADRMTKKIDWKVYRKTEWNNKARSSTSPLLLDLWNLGHGSGDVRAEECSDEFLEKRFPESRRKAYYLMAIHENLTGIPKQKLRQVGWNKATDLLQVARRNWQRFDCATWLHKG